MNQYQLTILVKPDLDEKVRKELLDTIGKQVDKVEKEDLWGNKDLVYPIKKQTKAFYAHFEFESEPATISDLDKMLKVEEDVLRFILIRR